MSTDAAFLLLGVATAFVFISAQPTCRNTVHCSCGNTAENFTVCADQNTTSADPCSRWPGCKTCEGGSDDPSCSTARNRIPRSGRKRQYGREGRSSFRTNPGRSARQAEEKQSCGDPGFLINGNRRFQNGTNSRSRRTFEEGESLVFSCISNEYVLEGSPSMTCRDGEWSEPLPKCIQPTVVAEKQSCGDPGFLINGYRRFLDGTDSKRRRTFEDGESLVFGCRSNEYALEGSSSMTCRNGEWSQPLPKCTKTNGDEESCLNPGSIQNGKVNYYPNKNSQKGSEVSLDVYPPNSRLVYSCNERYRLQGASEMTCLGDTGLWSTDPPNCVQAPKWTIMYCENPEPIINGRVQPFLPDMIPTPVPSNSEDDIEYPEGTRLQYSCNDGYVLIGSSNLSCLSTSHWSSDPPTCSGDCGRSFAESTVKVYKGNVSLPGEWPWVVSIRESEGSDIVCGGAVLNTRTVVTAAHCLTDSISYILYFGKIRKQDNEDDDKVMVRMSNRITIHPYYSDQSMDSDIGLIHFSDPIQLTDRVQPICLPDILSTLKNLKSGRVGSVAGFGEDEFGLQPNNLMHALLPVQDNGLCIEYYRKEGITLSMSQNMFCAGYAGADQATCQGDSGSALVFLDRTTKRYILEGLVSFSTNGQCGVSGRYIVFTKVFPYVPWLLKYQS